MAIKLTPEQFIENVKKIHGNRYSFEKTKYVTARTPIIITCVKHQYDFEVVAGIIASKTKKKRERKHKVGSCPLCIQEYFNSIKRPKLPKIKKSPVVKPIKVKPVYKTKRVNRKRYYICDIHGDVLIGNNRKTHQGCPTCNIEAYKAKLLIIRNNKLIAALLKIKKTKLAFTGTTTTILHKHYSNPIPSRKSQTFKKPYIPYDELKKLVNTLGITSSWEYRKWRKRSCHEEDTPCNPDRIYFEWISYYDFFNTNKHDKMSAGEKKIYTYLQRNNIEFVWQKKFEDCRNIYMLPFDFYLPKYNLLVEFDGQQHYKVGNFSKSIEINRQKFEQLKKNDAIKTKYCKDNNINLLRLNYDDLINNIAEMLLDIEIKWK